MNRTELSNRLLELEIELSKTRYEREKVMAEHAKYADIRTKLMNAITLEYDANGNAIALATWDGQERRLLMPLVKPDSNKFQVRFGSKLKKEGICTDDIEEWFLQEGIVYYWLKNAVMPIGAGFLWEIGSEYGNMYLVGDSPRLAISLVFESIPYLFPEFQLGEKFPVVYSQYAILGGRQKSLKNEIRRLKARLKRLPATPPLAQATPAVVKPQFQPARIDLKKTTTQQLKQQVLELLNLQNAREAAKWAKQQGLAVDLCYKAHWAIVLEKAQDVTAAV